jgi:MULE transposase domain
MLLKLYVGKMEDFGEATFIRTKSLKQDLLVVRSVRRVGYAYKFTKTRQNRYACLSCKKIGKWRTVAVVDGRIVGVKHPEDDHHDDCVPVPQSAIDALEIDRDMRHAVHETGKRPRDAYSDAVGSVAKKFKSSEEQEAIVVQFPSFNEVRRQLSRHRTSQHIPVVDPLNIPDELRVTLRGRQLPMGDINHGESFLLYEGQSGRLLIFCAETELKLLHQSEYIVCDGTFEMAPESAYQLYSMHGFYKNESMPMVWALLPNKTRATYEEMLTAVRQELEVRFGSIGSMKYFLTDFEIAAVQAVQSVFHETNVKGCSFHFRQAVIRRLGEEGKNIINLL